MAPTVKRSNWGGYKWLRFYCMPQECNIIKSVMNKLRLGLHTLPSQPQIPHFSIWEVESSSLQELQNPLYGTHQKHISSTGYLLSFYIGACSEPVSVWHFSKSRFKPLIQKQFHIFLQCLLLMPLTYFTYTLCEQEEPYKLQILLFI